MAIKSKLGIFYTTPQQARPKAPLSTQTRPANGSGQRGAALPPLFAQHREGLYPLDSCLHPVSQPPTPQRFR